MVVWFLGYQSVTHSRYLFLSIIFCLVYLILFSLEPFIDVFLVLILLVVSFFTNIWCMIFLWIFALMMCFMIIFFSELQNNLHELWSLLNFLLPEIFSSAETFDEWFQISGDNDQQEVVQQLHKVISWLELSVQPCVPSFASVA